MIGVVVGTGDWYDVAKAAALRMSRMTGLRVEVISDLGPQLFIHPSWAKCIILDLPQFASENSFLVFDADIVCIRKWNPEGIFESLGRPFCAVPDVNTDKVYEECVALGLPFPNYYVNGGLLMFGREHKIVWDLVKRKHPKCGNWLEQGALNLAFMHTQVEICRMPRWLNVVTYRGDIDRYHTRDVRERAINLHFTSLERLEDLRKIQESYGIRNSPGPAIVT